MNSLINKEKSIILCYSGVMFAQIKYK